MASPAEQARGRADTLAGRFKTFSCAAAQARAALAAAAGEFSYWDRLLVVSAATHGCRIPVSEDMQPGFRFRDLEIIPPFETDGSPNPRVMDLLTA